jgi:hypothetical protein
VEQCHQKTQLLTTNGLPFVGLVMVLDISMGLVQLSLIIRLLGLRQSVVFFIHHIDTTLLNVTRMGRLLMVGETIPELVLVTGCERYGSP